jgi:hypothetical protein
MACLDLDELPGSLDVHWAFSARRPALAWFRRADYLGPPDRPLKEAVQDLVARETGRRPAGPVRLLTHLRHLGYAQNPVSFYWCLAGADGPVEAVVAEITNTPWGERHAYVLDARRASAEGRALRWTFPKAFHVSPFFGMDLTHDWRFTAPGERLAVHMENLEAGRSVFDATLSMRRLPWTPAVLGRMLLRHPFMTGQVWLGIYVQALRLWGKRIPFHPHPRKLPRQGEARAT